MAPGVADAIARGVEAFRPSYVVPATTGGTPWRRVQRAARIRQQSEEQARRELTQTVTANPGEPRVKTTVFWASGADDGSLAPSIIELPLSNDPVLRSKQVLNTLLAGPVDVELRTLPPDAVLLAFYVRPDGTGIADFSEALATSIHSGIQSEQLAVEI